MRHPNVVLPSALGRLIGLAVCAAVSSLLMAGVASAAPAGSSFSCRASAARVALAGLLGQPPLPAIEPFVANNAGTPCTAARADVVTPTTIGPLAVNAVNVATSQTPPTLGSTALANGDNATASSTVTNLTLALGALGIHADVLGATAAYTCQSGAAVASTSGQVVGLTVNGTPVTVPSGTNVTIPLGPLGSLVLNQVDTSQPGKITRRAVALQTPLSSVVISVATAGLTGNPCAASAPPPGPGPGPGPTPGPGPGPGPVHHGSARLVASPASAASRIAAGICLRGSFEAIVRGQRIAQVTFSLDGRRLATVSRAPFQARVRVRGAIIS